MSAIWGAINLQNETIPDRVCDCMRKAFDKCKIDRYEELKDNNVYLGCGIQYFVPEAEREQLPYLKDGIYFDADVVLDNRDAVCEMLGIPQAEGTRLPDGKLLFEMYKSKGKECLNNILGAYTFVWYDMTNNKMEIVLDAVGNRCLYYMKEGDIVYFSSLMEPLVQLKKEVKLNDSWFTDFLGLDAVIMFDDTESTPFENIYRIAPAQYICINADGSIEKEIYWNPFENASEYQFKTDEEYQELFLKIWSEAVKDTLRAQETSILLSGGLDSTAVAAIASPHLKEKRKKLYSYTSVPAKGYQVDTSGRYIEDETENVKKTAQYYGNIDTTFVDMSEVEPWSQSREEIRILEFPYKAVQNSLWIVESMKRAYSKNSRIMLTGAYGNISISYGHLQLYANTLYRNGQKRKLRKELSQFSKKQHFSPRRVFKIIEKNNREEYTRSLDLYRGSLVNRDLAETEGTSERLAKIDRQQWENRRDYQSALQTNIHWIAMRQVGEIQTKHSLATGVLLRDPTCDKRILEFCIRLPIDQYCKDGIERRLVRVYMKDLVPPHVIEGQGQGRQSADIQYRMTNNWKQIREAWLEIYQKCADSKYVAIPYARQQLIDNEQIDCYEQFELVRQMYTVFALQYEKFIEQCYDDKKLDEVKDVQFGNLGSRISTVIYVYNDAEWLSKCIENVVNQTYSNMEILLFDDASEDKSSEICEQWSKRNKRIKAVHQQHIGEYATYRKAVTIASGDWIAFLTGTDLVDKDFYFELHKRAEENEVDFICWSSNENVAGQKMSIYYDKNILYQYLNEPRSKELPQSIHNYLYKKDILLNISGDVNDRVWNLKIMEQAHKCIALYNQMFAIHSSQDKKVMDALGLIAESKLKLEMNQKYFSKQSQEKALLEYYNVLINIYRRNNHYDKETEGIVKTELRRHKNAVRKIVKYADYGRKKRLMLWFSTFHKF